MVSFVAVLQTLPKAGHLRGSCLYPHFPHICKVNAWFFALLLGSFLNTFLSTFSSADKDCIAFNSCDDVSAARQMPIAFWRVWSVSLSNLLRTVSFFTPQTSLSLRSDSANKNIKMSSFKSSENIQKKEGGPDRSVSDNQSSSVTLDELAMKARRIL